MKKILKMIIPTTILSMVSVVVVNNQIEKETKANNIDELPSAKLVLNQNGNAKFVKLVSFVDKNTNEEESDIEDERTNYQESVEENRTEETTSNTSTEVESVINREEEVVSNSTVESPKIYTLSDFMFKGVVYYDNYKYTYYSEKVLPGNGLNIPGRHVNSDGYVSDVDGYIVLASSYPKGTVLPTPFGYFGKVYDRGTTGNHLDVYVR